MSYLFTAFSDVHFHPWTTFSQLLEDGSTSRLVDTAKAFDDMCESAVEEGHQRLLFSGDLFHRRGWIHTVVAKLVIQRFVYWTSEGLEFVMIPGNHDRATKSQDVHALVAIDELSDRIHVLDHGGHVDFGDLLVAGIGYCNREQFLEHAKTANRTAKKLRNRFKICLIHQDIESAQTHTGYVVESGLTVKEIEGSLGRFDLIIFGHYHCWQTLGKKLFGVGALTQHNFGDRNQFRGFAHVGEESHSFVESSSPKFWEAKIEKKPSTTFKALMKEGADLSRDFFRVHVAASRSSSVRRQLERNVTHYTLIEEVQEVTGKARESFDPSMSPSDLLMTYVEFVETDLEKDRLREYARQLIEEGL